MQHHAIKKTCLVLPAPSKDPMYAGKSRRNGSVVIGTIPEPTIRPERPQSATPSSNPCSSLWLSLSLSHSMRKPLFHASFPQTMPAVSLSLSVSASLPGFSPALYVAAYMLARQDTCGKPTVKATRPCSAANGTEQSHCDRHGHRGTPAGKGAWKGKYEVCWAQSSTQLQAKRQIYAAGPPKHKR